MKVANNLALPDLAVWKARSFWVQVLLLATVLANTFGVDLMAVLAGMGLGSDPDAVLANGARVVGAWQMVAPLVLGIWAWVERRAPNYRLVFWPRATGGQ